VTNWVFAQTTHVNAATWSCMLGGLREIVLSFKFRRNQLNGLGDTGAVEFRHFLYLRPEAYITANVITAVFEMQRNTRQERIWLFIKGLARPVLVRRSEGPP